MKKQAIFSSLSEYLQIILGAFLASIGLKAFILPNGFLDGGVTGIALLMNSQFGLNTSLLLILLSIPFLIIAYFTLSKRIMFKSTIGIICLAILIQLETFGVITEDKLLISIFGGLFIGLGIGIAIKNGAVLDGSEILGVFLNDRFGIDIGKVILIFNIILFSITAIVLSLEIALYSILTYIVTAKVIDFVIKGFEDFIGIMIVSKKHEEVEQLIHERLGVGMTIVQGDTGYGHRGKTKGFKIIYTIVNRIDIKKIHKLINSIDDDVFIVEYDVNNIKGGILRRYFSRKLQQNKKPPVKELHKDVIL